MLFCALTDTGIGEAASLELKSLGVGCKVNDRFVLFDSELIPALKFCYSSQAIDRLLGDCVVVEHSNYEDLMSKLKTIDYSRWLVKSGSFRVTCERFSESDFASQQLEQEFGEHIFEDCTQKGNPLKVDLQSPMINIYVACQDGVVVVGLDLAGRDLSKRQYRIYSSQGNIDAKLAYAIVRYSGFDASGGLLDLNCGSGAIAIEAALFASNTSPNHYSRDFAFMKLYDLDWDKVLVDKALKDPLAISAFDPLLRNVEACRRNAKLAGVDKLMKFSKMDVDWLGAKLEDGSISLVASRIPSPGKAWSEKAATKYYKELFGQAGFFLSGKGRLVLLSENLSLLCSAMPDNFSLISRRQLWSGRGYFEMLDIMKN